MNHSRELKNKTTLTLAAFIALAINGMTFAFVGTSLPTIQFYLNIDIKMAGFMMAILQIGFTLFTLISGILSDLYSREQILAFGCFLLSIGSLFLGFTTSLVFNMCLVRVMGAGLGCILSGTNALLAGLYPNNKRKILNIHHVFFSLGSFVGLSTFLFCYNRMSRREPSLAVVYSSD